MGCGCFRIPSWMYTFNIISSQETHASLKIIQLDFAGPFADIHISAAVAVNNVINNTTGLVVHLFYNYDLEYEQIPQSVTVSGNELYISVYAYSSYSLLSLKLKAQSYSCICIFIGRNVRPSLASIPHFIEKEYIDNAPIVNFLLSFMLIFFILNTSCLNIALSLIAWNASFS